jgi:hypothetical protein
MPESTLTRTAFFDRVMRVSEPRYLDRVGLLTARRHSQILKLFQENERVHFEVWVDSARSQIELGLHFEDGPDSTAQYLAFFDARIVEIKHELGPQIELGRWTTSWGHLYERHEMAPFSKEKADQVGERLAHLINVLQPCVVEAGIAPEIRDPATKGDFRLRWRGRSQRQ